jgi:hypothetical protein
MKALIPIGLLMLVIAGTILALAGSFWLIDNVGVYPFLFGMFGLGAAFVYIGSRYESQT